VQVGPPRSLYGEPADLGVGSFVGEAVVLPATVRGRRAVTAVGTLPVDAPDAAGHLLLRPEQLLLGTSTGGGVMATVVEVVFHGHDTTVLVDVDGLVLRSRTADTAAPAVGDRVGVMVRGDVRFYPA